MATHVGGPGQFSASSGATNYHKIQGGTLSNFCFFSVPYSFGSMGQKDFQYFRGLRSVSYFNRCLFPQELQDLWRTGSVPNSEMSIFPVYFLYFLNMSRSRPTHFLHFLHFLPLNTRYARRWTPENPRKPVETGENR